MRRKIELMAHADESVTLIVGSDEVVNFSYEEWRRFLEIMPSKVQIEEKRPIFALFGTRTEIRWVETPKLAKERAAAK